MSEFKRREFLKTTAGVAAVAAGSRTAALGQGRQRQQWSSTPEKGAKLRVLRWKRFVQGDEDLCMKNTKKFTEKTGIEVRVDSEGWEDVRPKAAVAANVGSGPDIIIGTIDDAHQYPDKLVDVTDVCNYLGKQVRRLVRRVRAVPASRTARNGSASRWACAGNAMVYRESTMKAAGFDSVPEGHSTASSSCARR